MMIACAKLDSMLINPKIKKVWKSNKNNKIINKIKKKNKLTLKISTSQSSKKLKLANLQEILLLH